MLPEIWIPQAAFTIYNNIFFLIGILVLILNTIGC